MPVKNTIEMFVSNATLEKCIRQGKNDITAMIPRVTNNGFLVTLENIKSKNIKDMVPRTADGSLIEVSFNPKKWINGIAEYAYSAGLKSLKDLRLKGSVVPYSSFPVKYMLYALYPNDASSNPTDGGDLSSPTILIKSETATQNVIININITFFILLFLPL